MSAATLTRRYSATAMIAAYYGLRAATVAHFRLHDVLLGIAGTEYPVIHEGQSVGRRWKACRAWLAATPHALKYQTLGPAPHFPIYNLDAVRAGEPVVLAAGEPDVWCLHQAGIIACTFLYGEGTVPAAGVRLLVARRPSVVHICYDLDEAGRAGAEKAYHALMAAGLLAEIVELPAVLGYKGDTADLYRLLGCDDAALRAALDALPRRTPPPRSAPSTPRHEGTPPRAGGIFERVKTQADIVALARRLTPLQPSRDETRYIGLCPFHDDHNPSFVVYPSTEERAGRFRCHPCGLGGDVIELARLALERELPL